MTSTDSPVEASTWLPITPEAAFELVTEPARLRRWLMVAGHIDVRVGGEVHLVVAPGAHAVGEVTEVEPGRRFGYTHGWVGDEELLPGSSEVTVTLEPERDGTTVTVRHHGIPAAAAEGMQAGWQTFMQRLAALVQGSSNQRDWPASLDVASTTSVLDASLYALLDQLRSIAPDDHLRPTPCPDFTVGDLVAHLIGNAEMLASALPIAAAPAATDPTHDPEGAVAAVVWPCVAAAQAMPASDIVDLGGLTVTGDELVRYLSVEFLVHAWDISTATNSHLDASDELCAAVLDNAARTESTPFFDESQFDSPLPAAPSAPALHRLLTRTGRHVS
ncbi:MAG: TIGR03086 family metal-binding protein [Ornithinimicrobium sp.]